ncbi:MAG: hypothetical protein N4A47_05670 [Clostridia bacterium]|jgi:hypothetical protein|nr:hypothetical protein [Clostridia bacterium]
MNNKLENVLVLGAVVLSFLVCVMLNEVLNFGNGIATSTKELVLVGAYITLVVKVVFNTEQITNTIVNKLGMKNGEC